jgi:uncharacterized protein
MPDILPLDLGAAALINRYLSANPPEISEQTFTNLYAWRRKRPVWFSEIDDTLVFLIRPPQDSGDRLIVFGPPLGALPLAAVMSHLGEQVVGASRQTAASVAGLDRDLYSISADRDNSDYVYRVVDLATLAGRKYSAKRNHIKQCLQNYDCRFEPIGESNLDQCRDLLNRWCDERQCELDSGLNGEWTALKETLTCFLEFELFGGLIRINEAVEAFAIGERLNRDTAVCHFEKAMPGIQGLGQLINHWFARNCLQELIFLNREQDLGLPGLRQAKLSYHPDHLVDKLTVTGK